MNVGNKIDRIRLRIIVKHSNINSDNNSKNMVKPLAQDMAPCSLREYSAEAGNPSLIFC